MANGMIMAGPGPLSRAPGWFKGEIAIPDETVARASEDGALGPAWWTDDSERWDLLRLAEHRRPDDLWHLWQAITTSFDTWCGLPHQLLLAGGGTTRTMAYVSGSGHERRDRLLGHLQGLARATDDDVTALIAARRRYYTDALRELGDA
ncbi:hypothetical protein [Streptomyces sp. NPDC001594]|uniref:hypothetical protein n=1 Tax=Streptomyces sp. NPDC001594 TaxID=3364590 RepID=UPI0036C6A180